MFMEKANLELRFSGHTAIYNEWDIGVLSMNTWMSNNAAKGNEGKVYLLAKGSSGT